MADYPEWVLKHKRKGTYVNCQNGKHYLYAAHSERIPGTGKVKRVSDGYLGRITEEDGFIPAKRKLSEPVHVYEYGLSATILSLCPKVRAGLNREFRVNGDFVMAGGALLFMHGEIRQELHEASWLSMCFAGLDMRKEPTEKQRTGMERAQRMIIDTFARHFGDDYCPAIALLPLVKAVRMGNETVIASIPDGANDFFDKYGLHFKEVQNG
jgi:hypothetical protein